MLSLFFSSLQGFTDAAFRIAHAKFSGGISAYYTPFLRLEKGKIRPKDLRDLEWDLQTKKDFPYHLIPQIIAKDAFEFRSLVEQILPLGFSEIDLNAGCPFPMQTKSGRGAGLLLHPENFFEILDAMEEFPQVQFSIKMRLGENSESEIFEILPRLNVSNLSQITLHPRLGIDEYHGEIRLDAFQRFYENCSRPMVLNGDIFTAEKIRECAEKFPKLKGVMLGRGLLRNPNLAREYAENFTGKTNSPVLGLRRSSEKNGKKNRQSKNFGGIRKLLNRNRRTVKRAASRRVRGYTLSSPASKLSQFGIAFNAGRTSSFTNLFT